MSDPFEVQFGDMDAAADELAKELSELFEPVFERVLPDSEICGFDSFEFDGVTLTARMYLAQSQIVTLRCEHGHPIRFEVEEHSSDEEVSPDDTRID